MIKKGLLFALSLVSMTAFGQERVSDSLQRSINTNTSASTFSELLVNKAGVQLTQSGSIGFASQLMIRGVGSINLNASPYIYVDGIPVRYSRVLPSFLSIHQPNRFGFINPNDISNMRIVSKGSELSEIGGRGTNGAIYIETNRGELGGTKIDFSAKFGLLRSDFDVDRMNAGQFKNYLRNYYFENGSSATQVDVNPIFDSSNPKFNNNTNWVNLITRNALYNDYHLRLKGGDGDAKYMFSVGYVDKEGTLVGSDMNQINLRFNLDYKLSPKIEISNSLAYTHANGHYFEQGFNYAVHPLFVAATKAPFLSPYTFSQAGELSKQYDDVDVLGKSNPLALVNNMYNSNEDNRVDGKIGAKWLISPRTSLNSSFVFNYMNLTEKQYRPALGIVADLNKERQNLKRGSSEAFVLWSSWLNTQGKLSNKLTYNGQAGVTVESYDEKSVFVRKINAGTDDYETLEQGLVDSVSNINYKSRLLTLYARGNVDVFDRMHVFANFNIEGSSNFGTKGRWGIYPGVKAVVDLLGKGSKTSLGLRVAWGRTGNNDLRGFYHYSLYYPANYFGYGGVYLGNVANSEIKPEITNTYDVGLKLDLFNQKLNIDGGYFYKITSRLITQRAVPIELGLDPQFENNGNMASQGFELNFNAAMVSKNEFSWSLFGSISTLRNNVRELNNGSIIKSIGGIYTVSKVNEPIGSFYGYKVLGVFGSQADVNLQKADGTNFKAGDYIIDDINKDSKINNLDRQIIGSPLPSAFGNFGTVVTYKKLSFNALFTYAVGNDIYNSFNQQMNVMKDYSNQSPNVQNRWISPSEKGTGLSRAAFDDPSMNGAASNLWVEDGSYLRLKNISANIEIGVPPQLKFIRKLNLFVAAENLATFTKYSGFDVEVVSSADPMLKGIDFGASPLPKSYIIGLKMSL
ncbi:SusC/RagA family TonB-linked outer membrane protein [Pedobacter sp. Du54]|uniref:SusC/RagA family TonB-linked outer membrane protein n=1 Tax=Pedobacter anseongensis TaxID=3133439 RepID=UPI0030AC91D3